MRRGNCFSPSSDNKFDCWCEKVCFVKAERSWETSDILKGSRFLWRASSAFASTGVWTGDPSTLLWLVLLGHMLKWTCLVILCFIFSHKSDNIAVTVMPLELLMWDGNNGHMLYFVTSHPLATSWADRSKNTGELGKKGQKTQGGAWRRREEETGARCDIYPAGFSVTMPVLKAAPRSQGAPCCISVDKPRCTNSFKALCFVSTAISHICTQFLSVLCRPFPLRTASPN